MIPLISPTQSITCQFLYCSIHIKYKFYGNPIMYYNELYVKNPTRKIENRYNVSQYKLDIHHNGSLHL